MKLRNVAMIALLGVSIALGAASADEVNVGDKAPDIRVVGTDGNLHNLRERVGKSWLVVAWYPKAATAG